jgi:hypothetical protein
LTAIIGGDLEYSRRSSPSSILADAGVFRARKADRLFLAVADRTRPQAVLARAHESNASTPQH